VNLTINSNSVKPENSQTSGGFRDFAKTAVRFRSILSFLQTSNRPTRSMHTEKQTVKSEFLQHTYCSKMIPANQQNSSKELLIVVLWMKSGSRHMIWSQSRKWVRYVHIIRNQINVVYSNVVKCRFGQQKSNINQWSTIESKTNKNNWLISHTYTLLWLMKQNVS